MADGGPTPHSANNAAPDHAFREALEQAINAVDAERNRVGAELHSGVAQDLTGLIFKLTELQNSTTDPTAIRAMAGILKQVEQILESVRRISSRASPPMLKEIGLVAALSWLADYAPRHRNMVCHVRCQGDCGALEFAQTQTIFNWTRWLIDQLRAQSVNVHVTAAPARVTLQMEFFAAQPKPPECVAAEVTVFAMTARVLRAGGRIAVSNAPDRASFDIELPAANLPDAACACTVLLCDENPHVREVTSAVLSAHGYTVLAAGSTDEALAVSAENPVHLLVADAKMGGGLALFDALRAKQPLLRAIFMGAPEDFDGSPAIGHEHQILKPFAPRDLIQTIRRVLL